MFGGLCTVVQRVSRTSKYYSKGIPNVAYVRWSHVRPLVRFTERMFYGPRLYVRAKDMGVSPAELAYVCLLRVSVWLLFSKGSRGDQVDTKGFKSRLSDFIKGSC